MAASEETPAPASSPPRQQQQQQQTVMRPTLSSAMRSSSYLQEHQQYRPPTSLTNSNKKQPYQHQHQHQQQPENHYGIDTVVEDLGPVQISPPPPFPPSSRPPSHPTTQQAASSSSSWSNITPFKGIPSPEHPPKIVDSGVNHDLSHPNCAKSGPAPDSLVATLFYKTKTKQRRGGGGGSIANNFAALNSNSFHHNAAVSPCRSPSESSSSADIPADIPANMAPTTDPDKFPLEPPAADPEPLDHLYGSFISPLCIASFLHLMSSFPLPPGSTELSSAHRCLDDAAHPLVVELTLSPGPAQSYLPLADLRRHELLYRFEREWNVDVVLQPDSLWRRHPRLVVFDMDSTLITQEVIDLLAATIRDPPDLAARVADLTHRAMLGELDFEAAFRQRVSLLAGLDASVFDTLKPALEVTPGVRDTIRALKRLGVRTAVLSGGFQPLTSWLAAELGIDHAHANEVVVEEGRLTGEVQGVVVGKERKRDLLLQIAAQDEDNKIAPEQVVAVGDGANDLLMMEAAGLGVAWNAKPRVQMEAAARLNGDTMTDLLYLFGFTKAEIAQLTAAAGAAGGGS